MLELWRFKQASIHSLVAFSLDLQLQRSERHHHQRRKKEKQGQDLVAWDGTEYDTLKDGGHLQHCGGLSSSSATTFHSTLISQYRFTCTELLIQKSQALWTGHTSVGDENVPIDLPPPYG